MKNTNVISMRVSENEKKNVDELKSLLGDDVTIKDIFMKAVNEELYRQKNKKRKMVDIAEYWLNANKQKKDYPINNSVNIKYSYNDDKMFSKNLNDFIQFCEIRDKMYFIEEPTDRDKEIKNLKRKLKLLEEEVDKLK